MAISSSPSRWATLQADINIAGRGRRRSRGAIHPARRQAGQHARRRSRTRRLILMPPPISRILLLTLAAATLSAQPPAPREPTHADILRGAYGPYRANNDLLFYHLDVRVDPEKKIHQRQEHHPLQDAQGRHAHPARPAAALNIDKILLGDNRRSSTSAIPAPSSSTSPRRSANRRARTASTSTTPAIPSRPAASAASLSRRIQPAIPGSTPPAKASAPASGGPTKTSGATKWRAWRSASPSPTTSSMSRTASSSARPTSATATRAGTGACTIPSTTTTSR